MFRLFLGANAPRNLPHLKTVFFFEWCGWPTSCKRYVSGKKTDKHREPAKGVPACLKTDSHRKHPGSSHPRSPIRDLRSPLMDSGGKAKKQWCFSSPCLNIWIFHDEFVRLTNETHQECLFRHGLQEIGKSPQSPASSTLWHRHFC